MNDMKIEVLSKDDASHRQADLEQEQHEIRSGDYWVENATGDVRLIRSLNVIDKHLHSLKVLAHPSKRCSFDDRGQRRSERSATDYTLSDFLDAYTYIDQAKAKEIRDREIAGLQGQIADTSKELSIGYIDDCGVHANHLLGGMATQVKSDMSLPISMAKNNTVEGVKIQIGKTKEIAEKQSLFVKEKTSIIAQKSSEMALYYTEVGEQSLASIDGTLIFVEKLQQGVHTLNIFLGEGVNVVGVAQGEKASNDEPLTFYQRKLFLDEEWFYNLADGGADYKSLSEFAKALDEDFSIINTIAPNPKSIVLMQFRRNPKQRDYPATSIGEAMMNAQEDEANREMFLLVRNGKTLHLIFSDDIDGGQRLFPTGKEINELFKDKENSSRLFNGAEVDNYINFNDIRNAEARKTFDARARYYQRIILMINGIHSRNEDVFGVIRDEGYRDWLSLDFQQKHFRFVHDDEDALGFNFLPLVDFTASKAKNLQAGSRLIGLWKNIADEDNAKGMWSNSIHRDNQQIWIPVHTLDPYIVEKEGSSLFVKVECRHKWNSHGVKNKNFKVVLDESTLRHSTLCVDYVNSKEIDFYLNSRQARSQYVSYAELLIGARTMLRKEEAENKPMIDYLFNHISSAYPELDGDTIREKLTDSISFWRVVKKGIMLPDLSASQNKNVLKEIADIFHGKTRGNKLSVVSAFAVSEGINILRISTNNKGRYFVYGEVFPEDRMEFGHYKVYPFVWKYTVEVKKDKPVLTKKEQTSYSEMVINEEIVEARRTLEVSSSEGKIDPHYIEAVAEIKGHIAEGELLLSRLEDSSVADEILRPFFEDKKQKQRRNRTKFILSYQMSIVVGVYLDSPLPEIRGEDEIYYYGDQRRIHILEAVTSIDMLIARYGSDELFEELDAWIKKTYSTPMDIRTSLHKIRVDGLEIFWLLSSPNSIKDAFIPRRKTKGGFLANNKIYHGACGWIRESTRIDKMPTVDEEIEKQIQKIRKEADDKRSVPRREIIKL